MPVSRFGLPAATSPGPQGRPNKCGLRETMLRRSKLPNIINGNTCSVEAYWRKAVHPLRIKGFKELLFLAACGAFIGHDCVPHQLWLIFQPTFQSAFTVPSGGKHTPRFLHKRSEKEEEAAVIRLFMGGLTVCRAITSDQIGGTCRFRNVS
jgi:hypothetical protein